MGLPFKKKGPFKVPVFLFEIEVLAIIFSFSFYISDILCNLKPPKQPS